VNVSISDETIATISATIIKSLTMCIYIMLYAERKASSSNCMRKGKHQVQTVCGKESIKFKLYAERKASNSNCMRKGKHQVQTWL